MKQQAIQTPKSKLRAQIIRHYMRRHQGRKPVETNLTLKGGVYYLDGRPVSDILNEA